MIQKKIIVVDDNNTNLTACKKILKPYYEVFTVPSTKKMFDLLENVIPDIILLDVDMPDMNGYETAAKLKTTEAYKTIPIIFLTSRTDSESELFGLNMGAMDYIHKPVAGELLLRRIEIQLSRLDGQKNPQG